jgi:hypothetical protein
MERQGRQEYINANRQVFDRLIASFEHALVVDGERTMLYKHRTTPGFYFVEGEFDPAECTDTDNTWQTPAESAEEQNELRISDAEGALASSLRLLPYLKPDGSPPTFDPTGHVMPAIYEHAVWRRIDFESDDHDSVPYEGRASVLDLIDVEGIGDAAFYSFVKTEQGVTEQLVIVAIEGKAVVFRAWVSPARDELYDKCCDMFGHESRAMELLFSKYDSFDELESALESIRVATRGIYPEAAIDEVLSGIRRRAQQKQEAREFSAAYGLDVPAAEKFVACAEFLEQLD